MKRSTLFLLVGDAVAVLVLTLIGFASHDEMDVSYIPRMGATFFPVVIAWLGIAPWLGLFDEDFAYKPRPYWRVTFAALYASTMAAFLRSLILGSDEIVVGFLFGLGGAAVVGMNFWRWLYARWKRSQA
jgi:hypothetical protein